MVIKSILFIFLTLMQKFLSYYLINLELTLSYHHLYTRTLIYTYFTVTFLNKEQFWFMYANQYLSVMVNVHFVFNMIAILIISKIVSWIDEFFFILWQGLVHFCVLQTNYFVVSFVPFLKIRLICVSALQTFVVLLK